MVYGGADGPLGPQEEAELCRRGIDLNNLAVCARQAAELTTVRRAEGTTTSEAA